MIARKLYLNSTSSLNAQHAQGIAHDAIQQKKKTRKVIQRDVTDMWREDFKSISTHILLGPDTKRQHQYARMVST